VQPGAAAQPSRDLRAQGGTTSGLIGGDPISSATSGSDAMQAASPSAVR
jgi:hypothetical protein